MSSGLLGCFNTVFDMVAQLFSFQLPYGISFGSLVVGVFGLPFLVLAIKKFF